MRIRRILTTSALMLGLAFCVSAQEFNATSKIAALRAVTRVAIVIRPNLKEEIYSLKELGQVSNVVLKGRLPQLEQVDTSETQNWLELTITTAENGAALELSLYKWVTVDETGESVFCHVWTNSQYIFGEPTRQAIKGAIDDLAISFASDYAQAEKKWPTH